jgi:hypothetical protein
MSGKNVGINLKTFQNWKNTFQNINLEKELAELSADTVKRQWLKDGSQWFFQIASILSKKNERAIT